MQEAELVYLKYEAVHQSYTFIHNFFLRHTQSSGTEGSLTLHGQDDGWGGGVSLHVAGLAGVPPRVAPRHLLHHQTPVGEQDAILPLLPHFHAL